jgi:hypothetical protein
MPMTPAAHIFIDVLVADVTDDTSHSNAKLARPESR